MLYKVIQFFFLSLWIKILNFDYSSESYQTVLSCGAVIVHPWMRLLCVAIQTKAFDHEQYIPVEIQTCASY